MKNDYMKHILFSGIIGVFFWVIGEVMYDIFTQKIWQPLGIALYFCLFAIVMVIGMYVLALLRGDYNKAIRRKKKPIRDNFLTIVLLIIILFIATGVFEFLYELGGTLYSKEATSYVFVIDDSGSMSGNDPNFERRTAIRKVMENEDSNIPYSVYRFTDKSEKIKEVGTYNPADNYQFDSNGGTDIIGSVNSVLDEIISNSQQLGESPRIMLVSDGSSSSVGVNSVISKCNDNGISISSISFGNLFGNSLLNKLATRTGGVYVDVKNINELYNEMQTAITSNATRNIISERFTPRLNWLYAILRILFLSAMALLWSIIKEIAYCGNKKMENDSDYSFDNVIQYTMVSAMISIIIMEFGTAYLAIPEKLARLVVAILWTIIPGKFYVVKKTEVDLSGYDRDKGLPSSFNRNKNGIESKGSKKEIQEKRITISPFSQQSHKSFDEKKSGFGNVRDSSNKNNAENAFGSGNKSNGFGKK